MLCDDILASLGPTALEAALRTGIGGRMARDLQEVTKSLVDGVSKAQRFVLSPLAKATADDLASPKVLHASRNHLFLPAERTWLEWHDDRTILPGAGRMGVLLEAVHTFRADLDYSLTMGRATIFLPAAPGSPVPFRNLMGMFDFPNDGAALRFRDIVGMPGVDAEVAGAWVCAVLCLINTPRIAEVRPHDHSRLNKARARSRKPPVLDWGEVTIRIDAGLPGRGDQTSPTDLRALTPCPRPSQDPTGTCRVGAAPPQGGSERGHPAPSARGRAGRGRTRGMEGRPPAGSTRPPRVRRTRGRGGG